MKQNRKRLTYANVMSTIAVFLAIGGASAFAATQLAQNSVGYKQLKSNAVTSAKIKKEAVTAAKIKNGAVTSGKLGTGAVGNAQLGGASVTSDKLAANSVLGGSLADGSVATGKLADGSVTTGKLADGSVATGKLADGSVTTGKLAESERSQAFLAEVATSSAELAHPLSEPPTVLATLTLPANGAYVVTGETEFIRTTGAVGYSECSLADDGSQIAAMSDNYEAGVLFPTGGVSLTGIANGGKVTLSCKSSGTNTFGFERKLIAMRVASVN